jgi:hypothetical protein
MHQGGTPPATKTLSESDFAAPIDERYFEDYVAGAVYEYGYVTVTEEPPPRPRAGLSASPPCLCVAPAATLEARANGWWRVAHGIVRYANTPAITHGSPGWGSATVRSRRRRTPRNGRRRLGTARRRCSGPVWRTTPSRSRRRWPR